METQLMTDCLLRISGTITSPPFLIVLQIEELKNDNALLRAQLQQHGIEVNGDATPQWPPHAPIPHHHHRTRDGAGRQQNTNVASTRPPSSPQDNSPLKLDHTEQEKERRRTGKLRGGETQFRDPLNCVANRTSSRLCSQLRRGHDLRSKTTKPFFCCCFFITLIYEPAPTIHF